MGNFVIIGGSSGIGQSIASKLIDKGNIVVNMSRTPCNISGVKNVAFDVSTDEVNMESMPEVIDGLAYCPGSIHLKGFKSIKEDQFLADLHINVFGAIKCIKACLPKMAKDGKGSILLFSTVAVQLGMPFHTSVAVSKGAIEGLVRSLAAELAPQIRVNALAPSLTDTPLASQLLSNDEKKERSANMHPLKRYGNSNDLANAATFLLTDDSSWVTGQIIGVDGGLSTLKV
jgi:NAD(P)-dependent dehydrogenase (short-subunit alcohol dehydrogenase family)